MRAFGAALAELHALPLPAERVSGFGEHLRELIRPHPLALAEALPYLRDRIEAVLAEMEGLARLREAAVDPVPLHRDFHLGQLFLGDDGRVWLIDWDLFGWGDPLLDVGNFLMVLETRAGDRAPLCREAFLDGYGARGGADAEGVELYAAFNFLRRACKHFRLGGGDWTVQACSMLERAEQRLAAA
jgi:aminoglycoside phosphotransferase (APT) family kinase protein